MNHQKNAETKNNKKSDSESFNTAPRINKSRFEKLNKVKTIETKLNIKDLPASLKDKKLSEFGKFNDVIDFIQQSTISKKLPNSNESESLDLKIDCLSENAKNIIEKCKLVNDLIKISSLKNDKSKSEDIPCIYRKTKESTNSNDSENENINNDSENENINNDLSIPVTLLLNKIDISHPNDDISESSEDSEISEDFEKLIKKKDLPYIYGGLVGNIYKQSFNRKNKNNLIDDIEKTKLLIEELNKKLTESKKVPKKPFIYRCISYLIRLGSKSKTENNDSVESTSESTSENTNKITESVNSSETTSETTESTDSSESTSETTESSDFSESTSETTENQEVEDEYGESPVINKLIDWKKKFNKSIDAIKLINSKLPNRYKGFIVGMLTTLLISKIYKN